MFPEPWSYVSALSILFVFTQGLTLSIWFVSATLVALIVKRQDNSKMIRMWDFTQKMTADGGPIATHHSCQRHANILFFLWHSGHDMSRQQPREIEIDSICMPFWSFWLKTHTKRRRRFPWMNILNTLTFESRRMKKGLFKEMYKFPCLWQLNCDNRASMKQSFIHFFPALILFSFKQ